MTGLLAVTMLVTLAGIGTYALVRVGEAVRLLRASRDWPTAPATVKSIQVRFRASHGPGTSRYDVRVDYDYVVDGLRYAGRRLTCGSSLPIRGVYREQADRLAARYARGAAVTARYDPRRHGEAVLEPRISWGDVAMTLVVAAM